MAKMATLSASKTPLLNFSGTIATGGTPQIVVPDQPARTYMIFQNSSDTVMYLGFGAPTATAALTSGAVSSVTVTNAGFGFNYTPIVRLMGGGPITSPPYDTAINPAVSTVGSPFGPTPQDVATAVAVLSTGAIASFTVTHGGAGYVTAPFVVIENNPLDPYGCFVPSANVGFQVNPGGSMTFEASIVGTGPLSVFCATTGKQFQCQVGQ